MNAKRMIRMGFLLTLSLALVVGLWGVLPVPVARAATITWDGGGDGSSWNDPANWVGDAIPTSADEVVLDNSVVAGNYTVNLPGGAVTTAIAKLTITPAAGNTITLILPNTNTNNPGFNVGDAAAGTDDIILNEGAVLRNSSGASAGTGIAVNTTANGTLRINNGGRYIHNTIRANSGLVSQLSTVAGTETGVFEYDVPGTVSYSPSASNRTYGSLTLTRSEGAATYTTSGSNPLTIRGHFTINTDVTYSSSMSGAMNLGGDLTNNGAALTIPSSQAVNFNGTSAQTISGSGSIQFDGAVTINNAAGVTLGRDVAVNGTLTLTSGRLTLDDNNLTLGSAASIGGTPDASKMVVATGSGELRKMFTGIGSFTFPVGDADGTAEYSPVTLNFTSGNFGYGAYAGVRLKNAKHPNNNSPTDYLNRYWTVTSSGISDFQCDVTCTYADGDVNGSEANIYGCVWDGTRWRQLSPNPVDADNNRFNGIVVSFSDFTGNQEGYTAVTLASFAATPGAGTAGVLLALGLAVVIPLAAFLLRRR